MVPVVSNCYYELTVQASGSREKGCGSQKVRLGPSLGLQTEVVKVSPGLHSGAHKNRKRGELESPSPFYLY